MRLFYKRVTSVINENYKYKLDICISLLEFCRIIKNEKCKYALGNSNF